MLKVKKKDLIKVIQDLQAELRPRLGNPYQTVPNDKPWLDNPAYVEADKFIFKLNGHHCGYHCWQYYGHTECVSCCACGGY